MKNSIILGRSRGLKALLLAACALSGVACGPTVFADQSALSIIGDPPPPPPPPPEVVENPKRVEVLDNKVVIHEKIQFEFDKAVIREESFDLLREIAETILENTHIKKISVEGHASAEGSADHNLKLSERRAKAVRDHLVSEGKVPDEMLVSKGWGVTQPIASNDTEDGREQNRRVEFLILEQDVTHKKVEIDPDTGEKKILEEKTTRVAR